MKSERRSNLAVCRCGKAAIKLDGDPIVSAICYCESCRTAGRQFEQAEGAPPTIDADGGADYCLYRKDWVTIVHGAEYLQEYRLTPASPTRRVVATCCNSPMFLDFTPGHWLTVFRGRLTQEAPAPEMRIMAKDRPEQVVLSSTIPTYDGQPGRFILKLLVAWAAMGFRRPKVAW
jgi:hypothetical protein